MATHDSKSYESLMGDTANIQESNHTFLAFTSQRRSRIVKRSNGRSLIKHVNVGSLKLGLFGYITDGVTTIMNAPWWMIIVLFCASYIACWLFFAGTWTIVAWVDGHFNNTCLYGINDFNSAFLFSIETQVTIGYGNKFITSDCGWGIFILMCQCVIGLLLDSFLLGLVFYKLVRPRNRRKTIIFSDTAVIYSKNEETFFEFRVCDLRRSQLVECHVRLTLYWNRLVNPGATTEEKRYQFESYDLECGYDTGLDRIHLLTPVLVRHRITPSSPLYGMTQTELNNQDLEILVILEGIVESTSLTTQALWSYTNEEIHLDRCFQSMVRRRNGQWEVDFARVNATALCQS